MHINTMYEAQAIKLLDEVCDALGIDQDKRTREEIRAKLSEIKEIQKPALTILKPPSKYRLKVDHNFDCAKPFSMASGSLMVITWTDERRGKVLVDFGCGRCGLFDNSVLELFEKLD